MERRRQGKFNPSKDSNSTEDLVENEYPVTDPRRALPVFNKFSEVCRETLIEELKNDLKEKLMEELQEKFKENIQINSKNSNTTQIKKLEKKQKQLNELREDINKLQYETKEIIKKRNI
jgi:predicted phage-related endonuclease